MNDVDKLAMLLDDPEIREMIFALGRSGPGGLHRVAAVALAAGPAERVSVVLTDDVVLSVAAYVESDADEVARQLAQLLPDLLDALAPGGDLIPAADLARIIRIDVALDDEEAGAFGN